jgi:hypothetical protein
MLPQMLSINFFMKTIWVILKLNWKMWKILQSKAWRLNTLYLERKPWVFLQTKL